MLQAPAQAWTKAEESNIQDDRRCPEELCASMLLLTTKGEVLPVITNQKSTVFRLYDLKNNVPERRFVAGFSED